MYPINFNYENRWAARCSHRQQFVAADLDDEESLGFLVRVEKIRIPITEAFHVEYDVRGCLRSCADWGSLAKNDKRIDAVVGVVLNLVVMNL